jgi:hypothetical protein
MVASKESAPCSKPSKAILPLARPATIPRTRVAETGQKANSYHSKSEFLSLTQGDNDESRKERIMFGKLETLQK